MFIPRLLAPQFLQLPPNQLPSKTYTSFTTPSPHFGYLNISPFLGGGRFGEIQVLEALMGFTNCIRFIITHTIPYSFSAHAKPSL